MYNAPFSGVQGGQATFYQSPGGPFERQKQLNASPLALGSPPDRFFAAANWQTTANGSQTAVPGFSQPSGGWNPWPSFTEQQPAQLSKEGQRKASSANVDEKKAQTPSTPSVKPGQDAKNGKQAGQPQTQEGWFKGSASTLIGAFKVTSALIITGGINAFFFGVPLHVASGLSALVAGSQSLTALKIHKEDSLVTQKIVSYTRKLMGRENDPTPGGKEWSMVPVWAGVCGLFGLTEALSNHLYILAKQAKDPKYKPATLPDRYNKLKKEVNKIEQEKLKGFIAWFKGLQLKNMNNGKAFYEYLGKTSDDLAKSQRGFRKQVGVYGQSALRKAKDFALNSAGGKKIWLGYIWSFAMASFGGAAQTVLAALMQQKVDRNHSAK